jgi:putative redox protein
MESRVVWKQGMAFEAELDGHRFTLDASPANGGSDLGPRPKGLTLTSLAGCTAMDVVSILQKMRQTIDRFEVEVEGTLSEEHPKRFTGMVVRYKLDGTIDADKARRAVQLSEERYCGVSATLRPAVPIRSEIVLNGEVLQ